MGITKAYEFFKTSEGVFRCPVCHSRAEFRNQNSLICAGGHCFDLSKHGYVNFAPSQGGTKYTRGLFENRRRVFADGFYNPLAAAVRRVMLSRAGGGALGRGGNLRVLDAGCGEGFFASGLAEGTQAEVFGVDLEREAVLMAAKSGKGVKWMVGDLSNIPLADGSMGAVANILSPANYGEFSRVLPAGGLIVKVIPGGSYLAELRGRVKNLLVSDNYSNGQVARHFENHVRLAGRERLFYRMPVNESQLKSFVGMTPMMMSVDRLSVDTGGIGMISIDVEILSGVV